VLLTADGVGMMLIVDGTHIKVHSNASNGAGLA
jgi:hypothetical protein